VNGEEHAASTVAGLGVRDVTAAILLILVAPAAILGQEMMPQRSVRVEALEVGAFAPSEGLGGLTFRLAKATCTFGRFRAGIGFDDTYMAIDDWETDILVPVHVGFSIWENPKRTWAWYSFVPDVYIEASGSLWNGAANSPDLFHFRYEPAARLALCCDVDYYGAGARLEGGWLNVDTETEFYGRMSVFYAGIRLRGAVFAFGF